MDKVETYQLCHPELLSEYVLSEILKYSCIALPKLKNDCTKDELVEIFKRIAMPLPQRKYDTSRTLGKKLNDVRIQRGIEVANYSENTSKDGCETNNHISESNRLKRSVENPQYTKRMRLSDSCHNNDKDVKRKSDISSMMDSGKRQKITWP